MSNDKQLKIGDYVTLWTGEGAVLLGIRKNGDLRVRVHGEETEYDMDPAHVSAAD